MWAAAVHGTRGGMPATQVYPISRVYPGPGYTWEARPDRPEGFGAMDVTKPYEFIGFGAMDVTKPYELIRVSCLGGYCSRGEVNPDFVLI